MTTRCHLLRDALVGAWILTSGSLHAQAQPTIRTGGVLQGDQAGGALGNAVASGDVNGDGYPDLLVGARTHYAEPAGQGAVFVYLGAPSGISVIPSWSLLDTDKGAGLGYAVACADTNGDGCSDIIFSSPYGDYPDNCVQMYLGSTSGPLPTASWIVCAPGQFDYGSAVCNAGDVNGDGFDDVLVSGDVTGTTIAGVVHLYSGGPSGLEAAPCWEGVGNLGDDYGFALSGGKDVNGDGYCDVLVGAPYYGEDLHRQGRVLLYLGGPLGLPQVPSWIHQGCTAEGILGVSVSLVGDINGDGLCDIAASDYSGNGHVLLFMGDPTLTASEPAIVVSGDSSWLEFGVSISPAGDVNGDRLADLLIGSFPTPPLHYAGHVELLLGHAAPPYLSVGWERFEPQVDALFGLGICSMGDSNGDGLDDFAIGAEGFDLAVENEGRVICFLGSRSTLRATGYQESAGPSPTIRRTH